MYKDGWFAAAARPHPLEVDPAQGSPGSLPAAWDPDKDKWELYNIDEDFSEANDLAAEQPEKLAELQGLFWQEAEKYHVLPLLGGLASSTGPAAGAD